MAQSMAPTYSMTPSSSLTRRHFLRNIVLVASPILLGLYTWQVEPRWVEMVHLPLPIRNLPDALVGRTVVQISDLHVGLRFDWHMMLPALAEITALQPDVVVYTGDFVSYNDATQLEQLKEFMPFAPMGRLGTAAILGNHDYGHGWSQPEVATQVISIVESRGIPVLRNTQMQIEGLTVVGVDDFWGTNYNPTAVLSTLQPEQPALVLCHNPDVADEPVWGSYEGWILAGHTHGGQVRPPFLPPLLLPVQNPLYTAGLIPLTEGRTLYINRGLGHLWQVRFNVRPEITIFQLTRA